MNLLFKDARVFVADRETFFNEWDGHGYYHSVLKVDSCILKSCSNYSGRKKHVDIVEDIVKKMCSLCICSAVLFSECVLKGISTSLLFTVTGHSEGGVVRNHS